jgi:protein phosphatase
MAGQACLCASVGVSKARRNQSRTCGVNEASGSVTMELIPAYGHRLRPNDHPATLPGMSSPANEQIRPVRIAEHAALTDIGLERAGNEDSYVEDAPLFAVADGMGGAKAGEIASGMVADALEVALAAGSLPDGLAATIEDANARVHALAHEDRSREGMGTTVTAAWVGGTTLRIAHVGDSRCYRFRDDQLEQLTEDHSLVGGLVRMGKLTPQEAEQHPQRSVILRAVGVEPTVDVDTAEHDLEDGDLYLLCSDGLYSMVRDEVVVETLRAAASLADTADLLIQLANSSGGRDNITVVLFRVAAAA